MDRNLPPLNAVKAFEVAARHLNLTHAAAELGVTQGAISKQVIALEDYIGTKLFERIPGGLVLTKEGRSVHAMITPAFDRLSQTFTQFSRRAPRSNIFRLSTLTSFASTFLAPRLGIFAADFPHIELEILTSNRLIDLSREEIDLSIRFGPGNWDGVVSRPLVEGELIPVCAPNVLPASQRGSCQEAFAFLNAHIRRLQVFSDSEWDLWARETGVDVDDVCCNLIVEDFLVAIAIIQSGEGFGLIPEILIRQHLSTGALVRFSDQSVNHKRTYQIVHPANAEKKRNVSDVISWFEHEVSL